MSEAILRFDLVLVSQPHTAFIFSCKPAIYIETFPATPMKHVRHRSFLCLGILYLLSGNC